MSDQIPSLSHVEFLKADKNYEKAAQAVNLVYVNDHIPGIIRLKKGKGFSYILENNILRDATHLSRIKKLAIPPAWTEVWICTLENGHIQATGLDVLKRKQYRYHSLWTLIRGETKFHRLYEFGKLLPRLRTQVEKDLQPKELTQEKVIQHEISLKNKRLARAVEQCRDIPGKELFQYYDEQGNRRAIESGMVNEYIRSAMGMDFSAKDFRTWAGSIQALDALCAQPEPDEETERKKNIVAMLDFVSKKLGNSRAICKKYYVHPGLVRLYEENNFSKYFRAANETADDTENTGLTSSEKVLLKILKRPA